LTFNILPSPGNVITPRNVITPHNVITPRNVIRPGAATLNEVCQRRAATAGDNIHPI
jgi:hypothetical protein